MGWYFTSTHEGTLKKKRKKNATLTEFWNHVSARVHECFAGYVAIQYSPAVNGNGSAVYVAKLLTKLQLHDVLFKDFKQGDTVVQELIKPVEDSTRLRLELFHCTWSSNSVLVDSIKRIAPSSGAEQGSAEECVSPTASYECEPVRSDFFRKRISLVCESISHRIDSLLNKPRSLHSISLFLQRDDRDRIIVLCCEELKTKPAEYPERPVQDKVSSPSWLRKSAPISFESTHCVICKEPKTAQDILHRTVRELFSLTNCDFKPLANRLQSILELRKQMVSLKTIPSFHVVGRELRLSPLLYNVCEDLCYKVFHAEDTPTDLTSVDAFRFVVCENCLVFKLGPQLSLPEDLRHFNRSVLPKVDCKSAPRSHLQESHNPSVSKGLCFRTTSLPSVGTPSSKTISTKHGIPERKRSEAQFFRAYESALKRYMKQCDLDTAALKQLEEYLASTCGQ
eukprot:ANDGO_06168.mRNA.1 hypothetical protein